mgnify:CR=1 FL=1
MAFCEECGGKLENQDKFCPYCGAKTSMADNSPFPASPATNAATAFRDAIQQSTYLVYAIGALGILGLLSRDVLSILLCAAMGAAVYYMVVVDLKAGRHEKAATVLQVCMGLLALFAVISLLNRAVLVGVLDGAAAGLAYVAYQAVVKARRAGFRG